MLPVCRYGHEHAAVELQKEAVYGLTEIYRDQVKTARLLANPGCYPTCSQLALYPLLKSKMILPDDILIDAKSGEGCQSVLHVNPSMLAVKVLQCFPITSFYCPRTLCLQYIMWCLLHGVLHCRCLWSWQGCQGVQPLL